MPLEDHPWGDRGFSVMDPIGNSVCIYSDREPSEEFKQYFFKLKLASGSRDFPDFTRKIFTQQVMIIASIHRDRLFEHRTSNIE